MRDPGAVDLEYLPSWAQPPETLELRRKLAACERLAAVANDLVRRPIPLRNALDSALQEGDEAMPLSVFQEFGRCAKTFDAVLRLAAVGLGQQAEMLSAVVVQSGILAMWATHQGERVDEAVLLHARLLAQIDLDERRELGWWKDLPSDDYMSGEERRAAELRFGESGEVLWTGHASLLDLAKDASELLEDDFERNQFMGLVRAATRWAVALATPSGLANRSHLKEAFSPDANRLAFAVNIGSGYEHVENALHTGSAGFLIGLSTMIPRYFPDLEDDLKNAEGLLWRAWKPLSVLNNLHDADECPCDRPGTRWSDCHGWTSRLGTSHYEPMKDDDLVSFGAWSAPGQNRADDALRMEFPTDVPSGPIVVTFTFRIPFTLSIEGGGSHLLVLQDARADPDDIAHFGKQVPVRIRLHNEPLGGYDIWPPNAPSALHAFFGTALDDQPQPLWGEGLGAYDQWVTVETPNARLMREPPEDHAFAFHRCLEAFNTFLSALHIATKDDQVHPVATQELGALVFRGAYTQDGQWQQLSPLLMHPEALPYARQPVTLASLQRQLDSAFRDLHAGRPFLLAAIWHQRATAAATQRGDYTDCIVSLQTSVESMMFDLLRMLLVDRGKSASDIEARVSRELSYRSLLVKEIANLLGGDWHLEGQGPVGRYWKGLYLLRNRVVHGGYQPSAREAEEGRQIYLDLREEMSARLWARHKMYPRTLLAKVGENGLVRRGWMTADMRTRCASFFTEARPFYWPADIAGR